MFIRRVAGDTRQLERMKLKEIPDRGVKELLQGLAHLGRTDYVPVFICGIQNSGTTLLLDLLDQSFITAGRSNETAFYISKRSSLKILPSWKYASLADFRAALKIPESYPDSAISRDLLNRYRKVTRIPCRSNRILDNSPGANLARIHRYRGLFEDFRVVVLFRDPVATIEGLMRKWELYRKAPVEELAHYWNDSYKNVLETLEHSSPSMVVVDHRDLLTRTVDVVDHIASHCGLERRTEPLHLGDRPQAGVKTKGLTGIKDGKIEIDQARLNAAPSLLTGDDIEIVSQLTETIYKRLQSSQLGRNPALGS